MKLPTKVTARLGPTAAEYVASLAPTPSGGAEWALAAVGPLVAEVLATVRDRFSRSEMTEILTALGPTGAGGRTWRLPPGGRVWEAPTPDRVAHRVATLTPAQRVALDAWARLYWLGDTESPERAAQYLDALYGPQEAP